MPKTHLISSLKILLNLSLKNGMTCQNLSGKTDAGNLLCCKTIRAGIIWMRCPTNFHQRPLWGQSSDDGRTLRTERRIFHQNDATLRSAVDRLGTLLLLRRTGATSKWEKNPFSKNLLRSIRSRPIGYRIKSNESNQRTFSYAVACFSCRERTRRAGSTISSASTR